MLIKLDDLVAKYNMKIRGVLHIGAHTCEEMPDYLKQKVLMDRIIWLEALDEKINESRQKYPNAKIYQLVAHDKDGEDVEFNITNNYQSSSILPLDLHKKEHPHIFVKEVRKMTTGRVDTFFKNNNINPQIVNFVNLDIQGNELRALQGMGNILDNIDYIYTEVNERSLYTGCALLPELDHFLATKSYKRVETNMTQHGWGDALYIRA